MFTFQNNIPEYYMKKSRDFQIFPRLDDILFLGIHQDIDTITELNNPKKCKNNYLNYLAEKVGFYTDEYIPDKVLINIISAFRTALKNKGTELGIQLAVIAVLKAENSIEPPRIVYVKNDLDKSSYYFDKYTINIYTPIKIINRVALREFLKYIIPAGHNFNIYTYEDISINNDVTPINSGSIVNTIVAADELIGIVPNVNNIDNKDIRSRLLGAIDIGTVVDVTNFVDSDKDGIPDIYDDSNNNGIPNIYDDNNDDGIPDIFDIPGDKIKTHITDNFIEDNSSQQ